MKSVRLLQQLGDADPPTARDNTEIARANKANVIILALQNGELSLVF